MAGRTLRGRLVTGLVVLLILAGIAVIGTTDIYLDGYLHRQLDRQLEVASKLFTACMAARDSEKIGQSVFPQGCGRIPGLGVGTFSASVVHGKLRDPEVTPRGDFPVSSADEAALARLPANGRASFHSLSPPLGAYQIVAVPAGDGVTYLSGLPTAGDDAILREVEITEVVVFSVVVLLAVLFGTGWVRLSLRPLRRVTAAASRITELPLASGEVTFLERVPDTDPRTEVGQVGTAFNRMVGHVESALARRAASEARLAASEARLRRFAADASHELRTPLAAIRGYAELARRHPGPVPADVAHALSRVESESARMSLLVDELLLLAQLDAGRPLARKPVDLTRLVIDAASDARVAAPAHHWQLVLPGKPVMVEGDEHRLQQVLANLTSNAAKHTPPGTTVSVSLTTVGDPARVRLSVADDGPGIPAELQPTLFQRFVRGNTFLPQADGNSTGLGLAIVDAVVCALGGQVSVSSRPGHTEFLITLALLTSPLAPDRETSTAPTAPAPALAPPGDPSPRELTGGCAPPTISGADGLPADGRVRGAQDG